MNLTLVAMISLGAIGFFLAIILYLAAQKFKVFEDSRIDDIEAVLPGANCGGCGFAGCRNFADECVRSEQFQELLCPVGGTETMMKVAAILGKEAVPSDPTVAVLRCNGSCAHRPKTSVFDGASSCAVAAATYGGDTDCSYGCLGLADCVNVCKFDAMTMNQETGLPEVMEDQCTSCGACVKACPKNLFEIRKKGPESKRIYVSCMNMDKGVVAKKACEVACIGCGKCEKVCEFNAITITKNLAYIDFNACTRCRKCVQVCPTNSITELHFPPRKQVEKINVSEKESYV
ncbi:MAG: Fe-S cluster domain-containing protein [Bacteroidales bacterium]|nr:Fe-S cluster domain-containing protein [Bacteroidales bacterium]